jgi:hypothetical protein
MICSRCGALLVEDRFMDWAARWRCLKCGNVQAVVEAESAVNQRQAKFANDELDPCDDEVHLGCESLVRTHISSPIKDQALPHGQNEDDRFAYRKLS